MHITIYENYYNNIFIYNLNYQYFKTIDNYHQIPKITKITLTSKSTKFIDIITVLSTFIFLEILTMQRPYLIFTKKIKLQGSLKNGTLIGSKITLRKKSLYYFLSNFTLKILPKLYPLMLNNFKNKNLNFTTYSFDISELTLFPQYEKFYYLFNNISNLTITYTFNQKISYCIVLYLIYSPKNLIYFYKI